MWKKYSELYEVSTEGHIRNSKTGRILREFEGPDGYLRTQFDGKTRLVHRVVANVFIDNPSNLPEVNHINGCKSDNRIENLEWCSRNYNIQHSYDIGLRTAKGEQNSRAILSETDVEYIRKNYRKRDPVYGALALAKRFGVAHQTICAAVSEQTWK